MLNFKVQGQPDLEVAIRNLPEVFDTASILDEGAAVLYNRMRTRFLQQVAPDGTPWVPSQAAILRAKRGKGGGTLFASGKLFRSLQLYSESPTSRAIGTNATSAKGFPYPILHQYGLGQLKRTFLGFSDGDRTYMADLVAKRLAERFGKL